MCRAGDAEDISGLYQHPDSTGLLAALQLHQPPDLKILYYELIRALLGREREESSRPDLWEATRTVSRIEGYQGKQQISHHDVTQ